MFCPKCGKTIKEGAAFCSGCGSALNKPTPSNATPAASPASSTIPAVSPAISAIPVANPASSATPATRPVGSIEAPTYSTSTNTPGAYTTNVHVQVPVVQKNGVGTAGFVLALIGVFTSWVPFLGWVVWFLGAVLSVIGLFRVPKGLAIAGTVISFIDLIILILTITACSSMAILSS